LMDATKLTTNDCCLRLS